MATLKLADILRLLAATDDPPDHLRKLVEWRVERAMTSVRLMTGAVAALSASLVAALLKDGSQISGTVIAGVAAAVALGLAYARSRYEEARGLETEYVAALHLVRELTPLTPLLRLSSDMYDD